MTSLESSQPIRIQKGVERALWKNEKKQMGLRTKIDKMRTHTEQLNTKQLK